MGRRVEPGLPGGYECSVSRCWVPTASSVVTMDTQSLMWHWVLGEVFQRLFILQTALPSMGEICGLS